jgi:hypothetical protein
MKNLEKRKREKVKKRKKNRKRKREKGKREKRTTRRGQLQKLLSMLERKMVFENCFALEK